MIEVVQTFPMNSVQDLGRSGQTGIGIGPSGAMDPLALRIGNLMLGNAPDAAALELQLFPVVLKFQADLWVALTGCGTATLDGKALPHYWAFSVRAGQSLELRASPAGARSYLAVAGGIDVPRALGSRSTNMRFGLGGHDRGRCLAIGDRLSAGQSDRTPPRSEFGVMSPARALAFPPAGEIPIRVIPAAEYDEFDEASRRSFWAISWRATLKSNRQGVTLEGEPLSRPEAQEMRSHGILPGVIQVPPSGQPLIQLADANCAGGYPKIGAVIDADLWRLGQVVPGRQLRFVRVEPDQALAAEAQLDSYLFRIRNGISHL